MPYRMSLGEQTRNAKRMQECATCKMLRSIDQHRAQIATLERKVFDRRRRGL